MVLRGGYTPSIICRAKTSDRMMISDGSYETRALYLAIEKAPSRFYNRNSTNQWIENKKVVKISSKSSLKSAS